MPQAPPSHFFSTPLHCVPLSGPVRFHRIFPKAFTDPLGFGKTASRFADPRLDLSPENRFGVVYFASTFQTAIAEAELRDRFAGHPGPAAIPLSHLARWDVVTASPTHPLSLLDLTRTGLIRNRIPTDVVRARSHETATTWSLAIHDHPMTVDGIAYDSRLTGETNYALYDRAIGKLQAVARTPLVREPSLPDILAAFDIALV